MSMSMSDGDDPATLDFARAVRSAFSSIAADFGLHEVAANEHTVDYRGACGRLVVIQGRVSSELAIAFTPAGADPPKSWSITDFMRIADPDRVRGYRRFMARSPGAVGRGLELLAADLRRYGGPALSGDPAFLARVDEGRLEARREAGRRMTDLQDGPLAEEAFRRRDWRRVVELYEAREERLDRVERKRLEEIARKRVSGA